MDFIVSKVAMSICALLVASSLARMFGDDLLFSRVDELDSILSDLSISIERAARSISEGTTVWRIPFLSNGDAVDVSVQASTLRASSDERTAMMMLACEVRTWTWNGTPLNGTSVNALEESSFPIETSSGHSFQIEGKEVRFENRNVMYVFLSVIY